MLPECVRHAQVVLRPLVSSPGSAVKANYFDNEDHVIGCDVSVSAGGTFGTMVAKPLPRNPDAFRPYGEPVTRKDAQAGGAGRRRAYIRG